MYKGSSRSRVVQAVFAQAQRIAGSVISGEVPAAVQKAHRDSKAKPTPTQHSAGIMVRKNPISARAAA